LIHKEIRAIMTQKRLAVGVWHGSCNMTI